MIFSAYKLNKRRWQYTTFPNFEPASCSMFSSNCCLLTCIQVSQEAGKVVLYSHLFMHFPFFVVIHTIKSFSVVNEAEVDVSLEFSCFFYDPMDVGNFISGSSPFSKSSLYIWNFSVHVLLKPSLKASEHDLASIWNEKAFEKSLIWIFFGITLLWDWNENWHFRSCGHCWLFQICWHNECRTLTASSFRIWSSSAGISSSPPALFLVMLPKAHLTSHSRMSGSRWVTIPSWLSGPLRTFFCTVRLCILATSS